MLAVDFVVVSKRIGAAKVEVEISIVSIPNITGHLEFNSWNIVFIIRLLIQIEFVITILLR